jgi:hypothetical protein
VLSLWKILCVLLCLLMLDCSTESSISMLGYHTDSLRKLPHAILWSSCAPSSRLLRPPVVLAYHRMGIPYTPHPTYEGSILWLNNAGSVKLMNHPKTQRF